MDLIRRDEARVLLACTGRLGTRLGAQREAGILALGVEDERLGAGRRRQLRQLHGLGATAERAQVAHEVIDLAGGQHLAPRDHLGAGSTALDRVAQERRRRDREELRIREQHRLAAHLALAVADLAVAIVERRAARRITQRHRR